MSHYNIKQQSQRESCVIFEIDLDINDPALDAEFAADPNSYGTPKTTNDFRAYKEGAFRTYRISNQAISNLDCFTGLNASSVRTTPPKANPGIDIGFRASAAVTCTDFISTDAYELTGAYANRRVVGSFYAKLFARNFIKNRPSRIKHGYLVNGVYDDANFLTEHYIIDEYQGPDLKGSAEFNLVDVLALTNGINAKTPEASNATLGGVITDTATSATIVLESGLTAAEIEAKFGANGESGVLAIGSEYMQYTVTSATGVTPVTVSLDQRGDFGTTAVGHAINSTVQKCLAWPELTNIIDIIDEIFRKGTDIDLSYIPTAEWNALKAGELQGFMLTNCIAKETEVKKLLNELIQIAGLTMYVDVIERKIKIVSTPNFDNPVIVLDEDEHLEAGSFKTTNKFERLTTRQLVSWAPRDYSSTEEQNYDKSFRVAAVLEEDKSRLGTKSAGKDVVSRWLPNTPNGNQIATGIAQREVSRFSQIPVEVSFLLDSKYVDQLAVGRLWVGSVFQVRTIRNVYSTAGFERELLTCQCTSVAADNSNADKWRVTGISYKANIPPNSDYTIPAGEYFNYVLSDNFDFSEAREYIVVISTGAVFGSTSTAWAGFRQGTFAPGATLRIVHQGQWVGAGGAGGYGGSPVFENGVCIGGGFDPENPPFFGTGFVGGPAAEFTTNVIIDNSFGFIAGGGGGGSGGTGDCLDGLTYGGGGGGGGQGLVGGIGGVGGTGTASDGGNGGNGSLNAPGEGGAGNSIGSQGFDGGALGAPETSAHAASGAAIITNGNTVTITAGNNAEQVRGPII